MVFKFIKKVAKGLFKGAKKLIKGVGKVFKKVAPILVLAGAVYFGGVGLGLIQGGMSWTAAATSLTKSLGLTTGSLGASTMTAAIKYAGYGGLTGAATSLLTGQDVWKGFTKGATIGAVAGAGAGALGHYTAGAGVGTGAGATGSSYVDPVTGHVEGGVAGTGGGGVGGGGGGSIGGWFKNLTPSQATVLGPVLKGGLEGVGTYLSQRDAEKAQQRISDSYEGAGAASRVGDIAGGVPVSSGRWPKKGPGAYQFNDSTGKYEYVEDVSRTTSEWSA